MFQRSPEGRIETKLYPELRIEYIKSYDIPYSKTNHYFFLSFDELFHCTFDIRSAVIKAEYSLRIRFLTVQFISFLYLA